MDQIQGAPQSLPHIVQVYQPSVTNSKIQNPQIIHISHPSLQTSQGKITYQQTITSEPINIPVTEHVNQNQIVMSCQQTHLQNIHQPLPTMQSQVHSDIRQPLQFTSHVILPQVPLFKQHVIVDGTHQHYYSQYNPFMKEPGSIIAKPELGVPVKSENQKEPKAEETTENETEPVKKRLRALFPNPTSWACNVRKLKHQRGEAYISRRGKYVPERGVGNKTCVCKFKCSERINETDREHIFKAFYSLNSNEKKHFLLNTTERHYVKQARMPSGTTLRRTYSFKYFFLIRGVRYTVCKNFYLGTLAISQKPIYNVHSNKSDMNLPKPDGRGLSEASTHPLPSESKDRVRNHIMSFKTTDSKSIQQFSRKKQYLESSLTIKQMYTKYLAECQRDNVVAVKESMYRKIVRKEFNLHCKKVKAEPQLCYKCKGPIKKENE